MGGSDLLCIPYCTTPTFPNIPWSRTRLNPNLKNTLQVVYNFEFRILLQGTFYYAQDSPCRNGNASQLRRLRLVRNNREGVLHQRSQEVAIERAPRPNRTNTGCRNLVTDGPSVEPSQGLAILPRKPA